MKKRLFSILIICIICVGVVFSNERLSIDYNSKYNLNTDLIVQIKKNISDYVEIKNIPISLKQAIISTEDKRFYYHSGFDIIAIARAIWVDIVNQSYKQGASTITQQLVKNLFLTNEKNIKRKLKEIVLSMEIEKRYSKNEILEMYLNVIYFGSGTYGISAASNKYFGKNVEDLTFAESTLLVGIPKAPSKYALDKNFDAAKKRQLTVLNLMEKNGYINLNLKKLIGKQKVKLAF